jgi:hypothetical protein
MMPSSDYYRRQMDTLLTLAVTATDPELSDRYRSLAVEYKLLAAQGVDDTVQPRAVADNPSSTAGQRDAD